MKDCIFCKIVNKEVPAYVLYEDKETIAFLDIAADVEGHTLVIPKDHSKDLMDSDSNILNSVMKTVQKISKHFIDNCKYEGVNLLNANGEAADQSVPHFHIHIIPRRNDDGIEAWPNFKGTQSNIEEIYQELKLEDVNK